MFASNVNLSTGIGPVLAPPCRGGTREHVGELVQIALERGTEVHRFQAAT